MVETVVLVAVTAAEAVAEVAMYQDQIYLVVVAVTVVTRMAVKETQGVETVAAVEMEILTKHLPHPCMRAAAVALMRWTDLMQVRGTA